VLSEHYANKINVPFVKENQLMMTKNTSSENALTIFYDGQCPLCTLEMQKLKRYDTKELIILEDLHQDNFESLFPSINIKKAMKILHGHYQGKTLLALDVTHRAWTLVGKGTVVAPLQFPGVKQIAHGGYLLLAKYRHPVSNCLYKHFGIGIKPCEDGTCYKKT
jgi:predicted DCC family thiol-disulfide oxidoreductase YuxK